MVLFWFQVACRSEKLPDAVELLKRMKSDGILPDSITFHTILTSANFQVFSLAPLSQLMLLSHILCFVASKEPIGHHRIRLGTYEQE